MKQKTALLISITILSILCFIGIVNAQSGCYNALHNLSLNYNATLNESCTFTNNTIWNVTNGLATVGGITIVSNNVTLDCAGGGISGNYIGYGIYVNAFDNVTVKNCNISKYVEGVYFQSTQFLNITNNSFSENKRNIWSNSNNNLSITYNTFFGCNNTKGFASIKGDGSGKYGVISNNVIYGNGTCHNGIWFNFNYDFLNISNNYIDNIDTGILSQDGDNILIFNNTIVNATFNFDWYMSGIRIFDDRIGSNAVRVRNISIINNTIINAGSSGINIQGFFDNLSIINNSIDLVSWADKNSLKYRYGASITQDIQDGGDTSCGIEVGSIFKGFISTGTEQSNDMYIKIHNMTGSNLVINNNIFSSDVDCLLWTQANDSERLTYNISLNNYWFRQFNPIVNFTDDWQFYISNNANELLRYCPSCVGETSVTNNLYFGYMTNTYYANRKYNYSLSKLSLKFVDTNLSISYNFSLINFTANISLLNGSTPFMNNVPNVTVTLNPNENWVATKSQASGGCDNPISGMAISYNTVFCNIVYSNVIAIISTSSLNFMYFATAVGNNFTLNLQNLTDTAPWNYSDVFYSNQSQRIFSNVNNISLNMTAYNHTFVFEYPNALFPRFTSIAPTIQTITWSVTGDTMATATLAIIITGTGNVNMTNLGGHGLYDVTHDGGFIATTQANDLTMTSGTWILSPHQGNGALTTFSPPERALFFVFILALAAGALYMITTGNLGWGIILLFIALTIAVTIIRSVF